MTGGHKNGTPLPLACGVHVKEVSKKYIALLLTIFGLTGTFLSKEIPGKIK
jgi:hypothetical protein